MTNVTPIRIELENVEHRFGLRRVFAGVNLTVQTGEIGLVIGANGAGKSTLLKIIAGLLPPSAGTARIRRNGQDMDMRTRRQFIGYVAPDLTLYRELTGVENLEFFGRLRGVDMKREQLRDLLELVGLRGRGRDLVSTYSSGMRQRLKYAFALLGQPPILLLDEPTANLDVDGMAMVERVIANQQARPGGGLVIVATNEPREEQWGTVRVRLGKEKDTG